MPYTRNAAGAWTVSADASPAAAGPTRLVIIDKQVCALVLFPSTKDTFRGTQDRNLFVLFFCMLLISRSLFNSPAYLFLPLFYQVDAHGTFKRSLLKNVRSLTFDSKIHTMAQLLEAIRHEHRTFGR